MKPTNVTGYPFSNGDRLTAISVNQICNALDAIQDYNDTIKEFEDLVEENTEEIKSEINNAVTKPDSVVAVTSEMTEAKKEIAAAINAKGGEASATESFNELAQDIQDTPTSGILSDGVTQTQVFSFIPSFFSNTFSAITVMESDTVYDIKVGISAFPNLKKIFFQNCRTISTGLGNHPSLEELIVPQVTYTVNSPIGGEAIKNAVFGTLAYLGSIFFAMPNLRNVTIGQDTNINLDLHFWTAAYVIAEGQSGIDELNSNLYNNLLTKLYDHSEDGQTRTLRIGWLANVSAENIAYANAKGWTLTT